MMNMRMLASAAFGILVFAHTGSQVKASPSIGTYLGKRLGLSINTCRHSYAMASVVLHPGV
jgi:hypothetical protein